MPRSWPPTFTSWTWWDHVWKLDEVQSVNLSGVAQEKEEVKTHDHINLAGFSDVAPRIRLHVVLKKQGVTQFQPAGPSCFSWEGWRLVLRDYCCWPAFASVVEVLIQEIGLEQVGWNWDWRDPNLHWSIGADREPERAVAQQSDPIRASVGSEIYQLPNPKWKTRWCLWEVFRHGRKGTDSHGESLSLPWGYSWSRKIYDTPNLVLGTDPASPWSPDRACASPKRLDWQSRFNPSKPITSCEETATHESVS